MGAGQAELVAVLASDVQPIAAVHPDVEIGDTFRGQGNAFQRLANVDVPVMVGRDAEPEVHGWEVLMFLASLDYGWVPVYCDPAAATWLSRHSSVEGTLPSGWQVR